MASDKAWEGNFNDARNYERKVAYRPLTVEHLAKARAVIEQGISIRQEAREIGFDPKTLRERLKKGEGNEKLGTKAKESETLSRKARSAKRISKPHCSPR